MALTNRSRNESVLKRKRKVCSSPTHLCQDFTLFGKTKEKISYIMWLHCKIFIQHLSMLNYLSLLSVNIWLVWWQGTNVFPYFHSYVIKLLYLKDDDLEVELANESNEIHCSAIIFSLSQIYNAATVQFLCAHGWLDLIIQSVSLEKARHEEMQWLRKKELQYL